MLGLSTLGVMNVFSAVMIAEVVRGGGYLLGSSTRWLAVLLFMVFGAIHYRWLAAGDRPQRLARWMDGLDSSRRRRLRLFAWVYPIASLLIFVALATARN
jgi:hypothetical protein